MHLCLHQYDQPIDSTKPVLKPADFGKRIGGILLDTFALFPLFVIMAILFGDAETSEGVSLSLTGLPFVTFVALVLAYFTLMEARDGQTLGKRVAGTRVIGADGQPLALKASVVRNLVRLIDVLPILYLIGAISIALTKDNRRLGDIAASTLVVDVSPSAAPAVAA